MGTWICHLRVADLLLETIPGLDETAFIYGNLAPDSGIPNETWTEFDPPKEVTHFLRKGQGEASVHDLIFYQRYLCDERLRSDPAAYSFRLGYYYHLICDLLWARCIGSVTQQLFAQEIAADAYAAWDRIKDDWYGLDQLYNREHREAAFWRVIYATPSPPSYLPFIDQKALHHQFEHIRQFYSQPKEAWFLARRYPYLNEATMTRMVGHSAEAILQLRTILDEAGGLDAHVSSAELLAERFISPFPAPLGDA